MRQKEMRHGIPLLLQLAIYLVRNKYRGGHRLIKTLKQLGLLKKTVRFRLSAKVAVDVPLYRGHNIKMLITAWDYERRYIERMAGEATSLPPQWY